MSRYFKTKLSLPLRVAIVIAASASLGVLLCLLASVLLSATDNPIAYTLLAGEACLCITLFLCGWAGAKAAGENRFVTGLLSAAVLLTAITAVSLFLGGGELVRSLTMFFVGAAASSLGSLLGANTVRSKRKHGRR